MIKKRVPQTVQKLKDVQEARFIADTEKLSLVDLSLDELANRYQSIEQQAQLFQGRILLEARNRFNSDTLFGQWCAQTICLGSQAQRTRLMNLARFFDGDARTLNGISISAAYEISAPTNSDVAEEIYQAVKEKDLSIAEVKRQIQQAKAITVNINPEDKHNLSEKIQDTLSEQHKSNLLNFLDSFDLSLSGKIDVLQECVKELKNKK